MHCRTFVTLFGLLTIVALLLPAGGCVVRRPATEGTEEAEVVDTGPPTRITIRISNSTNKPLDPQFYIGGPDVAADDLFVAENARSNFGVGGLGLILPQNEVVITVDCDKLGVFGTQGGSVGDDLTSPDAVGRPIVLAENVNIDCGDTVHFFFESDGRQLVTTFQVVPHGAAL